MAAASVLVVGWSVLVACSWPTADRGSGCFEGASAYTCNVIRVSIRADGDFALRLNDRALSVFIQGTDSTRRAFETWVDAPLGTHFITGTTSATSLTITFFSEPSTTGGGCNAEVSRA